MSRHFGRTLALVVLLGYSGVAAGVASFGQAVEVDALPVSADAALGSDYARTRAAIQEVLAQPEFADLHSDPDAVWRRVFRWIGSLFEAIDSALRHLPEWFLWLIIAWLVLILLAILCYLAYSLWLMLGGSSWAAASGSGRRRHEGELLGIRNLDFDWVYAEANRLLAAGDWPAATKHLYVAAILWLDRQRWITFRPAKTNRDYCGELRSQSQLQGAFGRLTDGFELIAYGGQAASTSTTDDMATIVEGLLHEPARAIES
jgi:hypothetical protein